MDMTARSRADSAGSVAGYDLPPAPAFEPTSTMPLTSEIVRSRTASPAPSQRMTTGGSMTIDPIPVQPKMTSQAAATSSAYSMPQSKPFPAPTVYDTPLSTTAYVETHTLRPGPTTYEKVAHVEHVQVPQMVTVEEEEVVMVPQKRTVTKQVATVKEVDRVVEDIRAVPHVVDTVTRTPVQTAVAYAAPVVSSPAVTYAPPVVSAPPVYQAPVAVVEPTYARPVTVQRQETPVVIPKSLVSGPPIVQAPYSAPVIRSAPPVTRPVPVSNPLPAAPLPKPANLKPLIPFCAEFLGTFALVLAAGFAAMYAVPPAPEQVDGAPVAEVHSPADARMFPSMAHGLVADTYPVPAATGYCKRCDGSLAKPNVTDTSLLDAKASTLEMIKALQLQGALQKVFASTSSTVCTTWCSSNWFNPVLGMVIFFIIFTIIIFFARPLSGAHMNPALSFAQWLSGRLEFMAMVYYWIAQFLGAMLAALLFAFLIGFECLGVGPRSGFGWWQAALLEVLYTGLLALTYLACMPSADAGIKENKYNTFLCPLTIAMALFAGLAAAGSISGALLNPAVTIAFEIINRMLNSMPETEPWWIMYVVCQFLGGGLAVVLFYLCRPDERRTRMEDRRSSSFSLFTKLACEFVGTWILTFTIGCSFWSGLHIESVAAAACLIAIYSALSVVSGGHFNPAVTVPVMISQRHYAVTAVRDYGFYILIQIVAAILAAFECAAVHRGKTVEAVPLFRGWLGWSWFGWGLVSVLLSCIFVLVFFVCTMTRDDVVVVHLRYQIALALGLTLAVAGSVLNWYVVAASYLNPAVSIGFSLVHLLNAWPRFLGILEPFLGGLLAYAGFMYLRSQQSRKQSAVPAGSRFM